MPIIEDIVQRLAAFMLTAIWFMLPLGAGLFPTPEPASMQVDASRMQLAESRVAVFTLSAADLGLAGDDAAVDVTDGVADATDSAGETGEVAPSDAPSAGRQAAASASTGRGGDAVGLRAMTRPGHVAGLRDSGAATGPKVRPGCEEELSNPFVEKTGDQTFTIDRSVIESYASDRERLFSLGWVARHEDTRGRVDGFRVGGIRCGNLLAQVGLRNRDVVHTINGKKVTSIFQALGAYRKLRRSDRVEVAITRRGEPMVLVYDMLG